MPKLQEPKLNTTYTINLYTRDFDYRTPMHRAALYATTEDHIKIIKLLKKSGDDVNAKDSHGLTPLHLAAANNRVEAIKILKELGADVNAQASHGLTPLHLTAMMGNVKAAKMLIDLGADVNAQAINGITPLQLTTVGGRKMLIDLGVDVNGFVSIPESVYKDIPQNNTFEATPYHDDPQQAIIDVSSEF